MLQQLQYYEFMIIGTTSSILEKCNEIDYSCEKHQQAILKHNEIEILWDLFYELDLDSYPWYSGHKAEL